MAIDKYKLMGLDLNARKVKSSNIGNFLDAVHGFARHTFYFMMTVPSRCVSLDSSFFKCW